MYDSSMQHMLIKNIKKNLNKEFTMLWLLLELNHITMHRRGLLLQMSHAACVCVSVWWAQRWELQKTVELIEIMFAGLTQVDQKNQVGVEIVPREGTIFEVVYPTEK